MQKLFLPQGHIHFDEQGSRVENSVRVEQYRVGEKIPSLIPRPLWKKNNQAASVGAWSMV